MAADIEIGVTALVLVLIAFLLIVYQALQIKKLKNQLFQDLEKHHNKFYDIETELERLFLIETKTSENEGNVTEASGSGTTQRFKQDNEDVLPRYSILFRQKSVELNQKSVEVFGFNLRHSQLYPTVQDYIRKNSSKFHNQNSIVIKNNKQHIHQEVNIDDMEIMSIGNKEESSKRQNTIRPKSVIADTQLPKQKSGAGNDARVFPGMYLEKNIGPEGGTISIQGAKLTIPAGALTVATRIRLIAVWKEDGGPPLNPEQAQLSSVIACEPRGQEFHLPVNLEIQHCAGSSDQWTLDLMKSDTDVQDKADWKLVTDEDYVGKGTSCNSIGLRITKLSQFTVIGHGTTPKKASKLVKLVAFAPAVQDGYITIRVYCVDDYDLESPDRKVLEKASHMDNESRLNAPQPLFIRDNEKDLHVSIESISKGWTLTDSSGVEPMPFEPVWHSARPSVAFTLVANENMADPVLYCTLVGYQDGRQGNAVRIKIFQREQKPSRSQYHIISGILDPDCYKRNLDNPKKYSVFNMRLRRILTHMLEPMDRLHGNDWTKLADHLKLPYYEINYLETLIGTRHGPMEHLLSQWEKEDLSLDEFYELMVKFNRKDVAYHVKFYQDWKKKMTENVSPANETIPRRTTFFQRLTKKAHRYRAHTHSNATSNTP